MTQDEYDAWAEPSTLAYAADLSKAHGTSLDESIERARQSLADLLPQGRETPDTWLLTVFDAAGVEIGFLWIGPHRDRADVAYVYDIEIAEAHRGRGLGRAAMQAAEDLVRAAGIDEIGLNVFGSNERARHLYDSLGYHVVATQMTKKLPENPT